MKTYSCDLLQKMSNEDLQTHFLQVRSEINKSKRIKKDAKDLEIYFCYILRELETRASFERK